MAEGLERVFGIAKREGASGVLLRHGLFVQPLGRSGRDYERTAARMHNRIPSVKRNVIFLAARSYANSFKLNRVQRSKVLAALDSIPKTAGSREMIDAVEQAFRTAGFSREKGLRRLRYTLTRFSDSLDLLHAAARPLHAGEVVASIFALHPDSGQEFYGRINDFRMLEGFLRVKGLPKVFAGSFVLAANASKRQLFHRLYSLMNAEKGRKFTTAFLASHLAANPVHISTALSCLSRLGFSVDLLSETEAPRRGVRPRAFTTVVGWRHRNSRVSLPENNVHYGILEKLYHARGVVLSEDLVRTSRAFRRSYGSLAGIRTSSSVSRAARFLESRGLVKLYQERQHRTGAAAQVISLTVKGKRLVSASIKGGRLNEELRRLLLTPD